MAIENEKPDAEASEDEGKAAAEKPSYMSVADFNKAASARDKRLIAQVDKAAESAAARAIAAYEKAKEEAAEAAAEAAASERQAAAQQSSAGQSDGTVKELAKLKKQNEQTAKELATVLAARAEDAAKSAKQEEKSKLTEVLTSAGTDPKKLRGAIALLHGDPDTRRVKRSADGSIVFLDEDGDEIDLQSGVKSWLSSDEGKAYMPPRGAQGSGAEPTKPASKSVTKPPPGKLSKTEAGKLILQQLLR